MSGGRQPYSEDDARASDAPGLSVRRPLIATAMLLALLSLFFAAGFWQLDRAAEKDAILERFSSATDGDLITVPVPDEAADALRFRTVRLTGSYQPDRQILLDNMTAGGRSGYEVLTPFNAAGETVLINRGWIPANPDRSVLPEVPVNSNIRTVIARINDLPAPGLRLTQPESAGDDWPRRLLFPTAEELSAVLGVELPAYQLQLDADDPDGYLREWQAVSSGPEKHLGYAFQWFSFALLAIIFYAVLMIQWVRARRAAGP